MENTSLMLSILIITPIALMLAVFRGRSRLVMGYIIIGVFTALFAGEIDGYILNASGLTAEFVSVNITPITEEILKALPIVLLAFLIKPDRQLLLECSIGIGVGFALLENVFTFIGLSSVTVAWAFIRSFGSGLMHSVTTIAVGFAMSYVIEKHKVFISGSVAALSLAIIYHSVYNIIVMSSYGFIGIVLPVLTYIPILIMLKIQKSEALPK